MQTVTTHVSKVLKIPLLTRMYCLDAYLHGRNQGSVCTAIKLHYVWNHHSSSLSIRYWFLLTYLFLRIKRKIQKVTWEIIRYSEDVSCHCLAVTGIYKLLVVYAQALVICTECTREKGQVILAQTQYVTSACIKCQSVHRQVEIPK